jgi:acetyl/propionyl-CoA carboxylase alpha subunit
VAVRVLRTAAATGLSTVAVAPDAAPALDPVLRTALAAAAATATIS